MFILRTAYYDGETIDDEHAEESEARAAWDDALWSAVHAPRDQCGDVRSVTLLRDGKILQSRKW